MVILDASVATSWEFLDALETNVDYFLGIDCFLGVILDPSLIGRKVDCFLGNIMFI